MKYLPLVAIALLNTLSAFGQAGTCSAIPLGWNLGANAGRLNGFVPFPQSSYVHRNVSASAVDANSPNYIADARQTADRRFFFQYPPQQGGPVGGFHYQVVTGSQRRVNIIYDMPDAVPGQSDPGPMPIPFSPVVEGAVIGGNPFFDYAGAATGDSHVHIIDRDNCVLYQLFNVYWDGSAIHAGAGAVFDLLGGDRQRPLTWVSGSVSGLPLFPLLLRTEEIDGTVPINHPIAVSMAVMAGSGNFYPKHSFVAPASAHQFAGGFNPWWHPENLPFGAVIRLKATFDTSAYPVQAQRILNAMKQYGIMFVDGGHTVDLYTYSSQAWDPVSTAFVYETLKLTQNDWEVVQIDSPIYCDSMYAAVGANGGNLPLCPNSTANHTGPKPVISAFNASSVSVQPGQPVTLSWSVSGVPTRLRFITPYVGAVVSESVTVNPVKTTTYTLAVQNEFGRTTQTVTVNVGSTTSVNLHIGTKPDSIANATSTQVTVTPPPGGGAPVQASCSASGPCIIPVNPQVQGQNLQVNYLSGSNQILASSSKILLALF